jgi:hypothetical protein
LFDFTGLGLLTKSISHDQSKVSGARQFLEVTHPSANQDRRLLSSVDESQKSALVATADHLHALRRVRRSDYTLLALLINGVVLRQRTVWQYLLIKRCVNIAFSISFDHHRGVLFILFIYLFI